MDRGIYALVNARTEFFDSPIRLPKLAGISENYRQERWEQALAIARAGDCVQVLDTTSILSRSIARIDHGTWSHTALYEGAGQVIEAITTGVTERSIEAYNRPGVRVGFYRQSGTTPEQIDRTIWSSRSQLGKPYAWEKVAKLALHKILLDVVPIKPSDVSPNDIIAMSDFALVALV